MNVVGTWVFHPVIPEPLMPSIACENVLQKTVWNPVVAGFQSFTRVIILGVAFVVVIALVFVGTSVLIRLVTFQMDFSLFATMTSPVKILGIIPIIDMKSLFNNFMGVLLIAILSLVVYFLIEPQQQKRRFFYRNSAIAIFSELGEIIKKNPRNYKAGFYAGDEFESFVVNSFGPEYLERLPYQREKIDKMVFSYDPPYFLWGAPSPVQDGIVIDVRSLPLADESAIKAMTYSPTNGIDSKGSIFFWGIIKENKEHD